MTRFATAALLIIGTLGWMTTLQAATRTVGTCPSATHTNFQAAFNQLGSQSGPHTIRLCPGSHTTPPLFASWGHQGLLITSVTGNPNDSELIATGGTLLTATSQNLSVTNLSIVGNLNATGFSNIAVQNANVTGSVSTNGNLSIAGSQIDGDLTSSSGSLTLDGSDVSGSVQAQNTSTFSGSSIAGSATITNGSLTLENGSIDGNLSLPSGTLDATNWDFIGDITATSGVINITGGTIEGNIDGGSQNLSLSNVNMTAGSLHVDGGQILINDSQIGSNQQPIPIHANNGIDVSSSQIWGDLTAASWAEIYLDAPTIVRGTCTPEASGPGICELSNVILTANGQSDSPVFANIGEAVDLAALVNNCPNESSWRDTWNLAGNEDDNTFSTSACNRSPIENTISFSTPGTYQVSFKTEYCDIRFLICWSWKNHGSDSITIIVEEDVPQPETLLEYRMEQSSWDGTSGEVEDTSGNGNDGTSVGDADTEIDEPAIPGNPGTCRYATFEASSDFRDGGYIQSPGLSSTLNDTATMTFWIRTTQTSDNSEAWQSPGIAGIEEVGGTEDIFWGWIDQAGRIGISVGDDYSANQKSTQPISDGSWRHIALTWDQSSGDTEIYVDGVLDQSGNTGGGQVIGNSYSSIGRIENTNPGIAPYYFDGELDELRIYEGVLSAAEIAAISNQTRPCDIGYDHIRLHHPDTGLTCSPVTILVEACADPDCDSLYDGTVGIDFTSPTSNWTPDPVSFDGSVNVMLQHTTPGTVTLGAVAIDPVVSNPTQCFTPGGANPSCEMEFFESGFVIDIPDHVADTSVTGTIAAVRSDPNNPEQCVPGFDEPKDVRFWSQYFNPGSGSLQAGIDGNPIATAAPGTTIPIAFDGNGVGSFQLQYPDVGNVAVNAEYSGSGQDAGLDMTGQGHFVARPAGFTLDIPGNPAATDENGDVFMAAGENFEITVAARNYNNGITPNFGRESTPEGVDLELELVAPSGGSAPGLSGGFGSFGTDCDNNGATAGTACGEFFWPEVGIISLEPRLKSGAYLDTADVVGSRVDHVGRFIPDHFELGSSEIIDRAGLSECDDSPFTYIGERFDAKFTLYAKNAHGITTANYQGAFEFLGGGDLDLSGTPAPDINGVAVAWTMGAGDASAQLTLPRSGPEGPYPDYEVTTAPVDGDGVSLSGSGLVGSTELRFGRIVIDNAIGSELGPLDLPWRAEYWDGTTWLVNADDDCTVLDLAADVELTSSGGDTGDGTETVSVDTGTSSIDPSESDLTLNAGIGSLHFTPPRSPGWVDALLGLDSNWPYLRDELDDDSDTPYEENPEARASFGLFDGSSQRIYIREIAPQ